MALASFFLSVMFGSFVVGFEWPNGILTGVVFYGLSLILTISNAHFSVNASCES